MYTWHITFLGYRAEGTHSDTVAKGTMAEDGRRSRIEDKVRQQMMAVRANSDTESKT
jgi:hypothetical protein